MSWLDKLKNDIEKDKAERVARANVQPGDEVAPADTLRNKAIDFVGLPQDWRTTIAQEKLRAVQPEPIAAKGPAALAAPPEVEAVGAAAELTPALRALAAQMKSNPKMPLQVTNSFNMSNFQKLRDILGHVGPVIIKGGK